MSPKNGFTLVELVIVIILLGIVSTVVLPRFFSQDTFTNAYQRSEFDSAISWVRNRTVTAQCSHEIQLTTTGWKALRDIDCSTIDPEPACNPGTEPLNLFTPVSDGAGNLLAGSAPSTLSGTQRLIFTATGQLFVEINLPTTAGCTALPTVPVSNGTNLTLSPNTTLSMDGDTAYVAIQ
ncbi:type II secretion system protein [Reinekea sp.]|jgi:MSHA pilin protein MshC|uniref:type II secretion system protein n=1 Tax=Reinekea sp. TaxID=1970455 RepID=UPI002A80D165|nr:type II secretion system protein [Reinekea sp.]